MNPIVFLQANEVDLWRLVIEKGGLSGLCLLLLIGIVILWKKLESKDNQLSELNARIKADTKEDIRLFTSVEALLDRLISDQSEGKKEIIASVRNEAASLKESINIQLEHVKGRTSGND